MEGQLKIRDVSVQNSQTASPAPSQPKSSWSRIAANPAAVKPAAPAVAASKTGESPFKTAKAYLLAVWMSLLRSKKSYAGAVAALDNELARASKRGIPTDWETGAPTLPPKWSSSLEPGFGLFVLKVASPTDADVIHLTIPRETSVSESPHLTWRQGIRQEPQRESVPMKAGRRTRRSLPKQKRTRRVVRRLVRA